MISLKCQYCKTYEMSMNIILPKGTTICELQAP